ncbi:MAG: capsid protein [Cressdnaviricota sp.]|nr:MAG: capsid protein [Cressdnaviricota sp.]
MSVVRYGSRRRLLPAATAAAAWLRQRWNRPTDIYTGRSRGLAMGDAWRTRNRVGQSYTQRRKLSSRGVLGGSDANAQVIYRRKRMPKKKRRRWRRFVQKVNAVDERDLGSRTVLFNTQISAYNSSAAAGNREQGALTLGLYTIGGQSSTRADLQDLRRIMTLENTANPTAALGSTVYDTTKYLFQSGVVDITIRNGSVRAVGAGSYTQLDGDIECDMYEISLSRSDIYRFDQTAGTVNQWNDLSELLNANDTPEIGGAGVGMSISDRGASPWEFPQQIGQTRLKIWKKTKFFIPNGRTITYQLRDPKRHVVVAQDTSQLFSINRPGLTRFVYLVWKLVPGLIQGGPAPAAGEYDARIEVGCTRKYMYKIEGVNEDRERYLADTVAPVLPA